MKKSSLKKRHFSLIELLVVIGIIGILSAIILPALSGARKSANKTHIKAQLQNVALACMNYYNDYGHLPNESGSNLDTEVDLANLINALDGTSNARGKIYYSGSTSNFEKKPILVDLDFDYDGKQTNVSTDSDTVNDRVAVHSTYEGEVIKSWVK